MLGVASLNFPTSKTWYYDLKSCSSFSTSCNIGTPGSDDRHLEFPLPLWCGNVGSVASELPDPENIYNFNHESTIKQEWLTDWCNRHVNVVWYIGIKLWIIFGLEIGLGLKEFWPWSWSRGSRPRPWRVQVLMVLVLASRVQASLVIVYYVQFPDAVWFLPSITLC